MGKRLRQFSLTMYATAKTHCHDHLLVSHPRRHLLRERTSATTATSANRQPTVSIIAIGGHTFLRRQDSHACWTCLRLTGSPPREGSEATNFTFLLLAGVDMADDRDLDRAEGRRRATGGYCWVAVAPTTRDGSILTWRNVVVFRMARRQWRALEILVFVLLVLGCCVCNQESCAATKTDGAGDLQQLAPGLAGWHSRRV